MSGVAYSKHESPILGRGIFNMDMQSFDMCCIQSTQKNDSYILQDVDNFIIMQ